MEIDFWKERWSQNQIAFHLPEVNPYLNKYWSNFNVTESTSVFIPLCGKSLDIAWFAAQQYSVLGVECSEKAIKEFFNDQKLNIKPSQEKHFISYKNNNINLLQGDFFKLTKDFLHDISVVYDRASLIALPAELRAKYVKLLSEILPVNIEIFLITLEYSQSKMSGPPFSVNHEEIISLYEPNFKVQLLGESDVLEGHQKFKERGLNYLIERAYKITS